MAVVPGRRLESSPSYADAVLPSIGPYFAFDGTNSDLARQLYLRGKAGDKATKFSNFAVPDKVQARLDDLGVSWDDLSGIAQRAVLWDTGFGVTQDHKPIQIWTLAGHSMMDLAVPLVQFNAVGCTERNCSQPDGTWSLSNLYCNGEQMLNAARCVMEDFVDPEEIHLAMWITGGNPEGVPTPTVRKHAWEDASSNISYVVLAVHTVDIADEPAYGECATNTQNEGYGSLVLACHTKANITDGIRGALEEIEGSPWVSRWLAEDYSNGGKGTGSGSSTTSTSATDGGFKLIYLVPIVVGALIIVALIVLAVFLTRRRSQNADNRSFENHVASPSAAYQRDPVTPLIQYQPRPSLDQYRAVKDHGSSQDNISLGRPTVATSEDTETGSRRSIDSTIRFRPSYDGEFSSDSNQSMRILLSSKHLQGKRIPFDSLTFERALSKGVNGEVWLGRHQGQNVAIKRLLQTNTHHADEVEEFAREIELSASLSHPNIISFIGVAWSTLDNLVMVLDFFPTGDLQSYLKKNAEAMSWAKDKIHIAAGIGRAVVYLHTRSPPIIHRDLKSKNVLLTNDLEAKLIDFGVSRGLAENTMTAGVGTPYWTAPEILQGGRYTEQADIYSFGVILSELDTGKFPYHDVLRPDGKKPRPFQIMEDVMTGKLRPSFSEDCPPRISRISTACCQHDPARRPTASQVVRILNGDDYVV
ncbi:hypothetical protein V7S43_014218 [Phytophthora oleae]|uniref:Protein kinase domain-containing protein n=1 Tax=Phytophthora oleae TaxID=2107226 RepID=A0ABD3F2S6_9STRA